MMNFSQVAELIKQGFTEEQIRAVYTVMGRDAVTDTNTNTSTPTSTHIPTPAPAPAAATVTVQSPAPADNPAQTSPTGGQNESETVSLLKEMLGLIRKGNIDTMGGGAPESQDGADVLAEILNPTPKK